MVVLVSYDIASASPEGRRRLRRVAQACEDYGQRVQYSVFECVIDALNWARLRARLLSIIDLKEDSLRVYFLDDDVAKRTEHHGVRAPIDFNGPLVV